MSKAFMVGVTAGLIFFIGTHVGASRLRPQRTEQEPRQEALQEATPIELGKVTWQEHLNGKRYGYYKEACGGKSILEVIALAKGQDVKITLSQGYYKEANDTVQPEDFLRQTAAKTDAIVRGKIKHKTSQITEDQGFIFTQYELVVVEVLKDNQTAFIRPGSSITVVRPGGKVVINGTLVTATDDSLPPLKIRDHNEVVLFLTNIRETGDYEAVSPTGVIELDYKTKKIRFIASQETPKAMPQSPDGFLQTLRTVCKSTAIQQ